MINNEANFFKHELEKFSDEKLLKYLRDSSHVEKYYEHLSSLQKKQMPMMDYINELVKLIDPPEPPAIVKKDDVEPWLDPVWRINRKTRWNNYRQMLIEQGKEDMISNLDVETFEILDSCHNPNEREILWDRRGLVYGHVQSGKTANYVGLINKALDVGYKIIIVLTGMTEDLRRQTQDRIDEGVIGRKPNGEVYGVGHQSQHQSVNDVTPATDIHIDLSNSNVNASINYNQKSIWVIKKNKSVLENLIKWLDSQRTTQGHDRIHYVPFLIIDDEADNASIQSMSKKEFDVYSEGLEVADLDEDDLSIEEEDKLELAKERVIKAINRNIRVALSLIGQKTFVAYTATPYSVINQSERDMEHSVTINGKDFKIDKNTDLFPEDFIIPIRPGSKYMGIEKVFPSDHRKKIPVITNITSEEFKEDLINDDYDEPLIYFFPRKRDEDYTFIELPLSMKEAIIHFIVSIHVRKKRGFVDYNSMLIHTSHLTKKADYVAARINDFLNTLRSQFISKNLSYYSIFQNRLELIRRNSKNPLFKEYFGNNSYETPNAISVSDIVDILSDTQSPLDVVSYHSSRAQDLEHHNHTLRYDLKIPRNYIVVGGNRLSRGLTLEGLTTSYFVRSSTRQDSLYQMARWFGYRVGFEDVIQIFMPENRIHWFEDIYKLEMSLRNDLDDMNESNIMPRDWAIKLANHKSLSTINNRIFVCDPNKLRNTSEQELSISGNVATWKLKRDNSIHLRNYETIKRFINQVSSDKAVRLFDNTKLCEEIKNNNINYENVSFKHIANLFDKYIFHEDEKKNFDLLSEYMRKNSTELGSWSVVLVQKINMSKKIGDNWKLTSYDQNGEKKENEIVALTRSINDVKSFKGTAHVGSILDRDRDNTFDIINKNNIDEYLGENSNKGYLRLKERNARKKPILIIYLAKGKLEDDNEIVFPLIYTTTPNIENGAKVRYIVRNRH